MPDRIADRRPWHRRINPRLIADFVAFATAVIGLVIAVMAVGSRDTAEDRAKDLSEQIAALDAEIANLAEERDKLRDELAEVAPSGSGESAAAGDSTDEVAGGSYADLDQALETNNCRYGRWEASTLQIAGEQYFDGFQCEMVNAWADEPPYGYVDLLVPAGAQRLTGLAGIDERSADSTAVLRFSIIAVPEAGDPLFSTAVPYGSDGQAFDVSLEGVSRVRFQIELASSDYVGDSKPAIAGWASVRFE